MNKFYPFGFKLDFKRFRPKERSHRWSLTFVFSLVVFLFLFFAIAVTALSVWLLIALGVMKDLETNIQLGYVILMMSVTSLLIGWIVVFFSSKIPLKPVNNLINKMNRLAEGDFQARLEFKGALGNHPAFREISTSFNRMATELENTELLRTDFINNFSHEVKTPIVSIAGFAKLLNRGNLSEEQQKQYLQSIEEEAMRLSNMATNVLNLTKVESQTILTEVSVYNLSEQLRSAVLYWRGNGPRRTLICNWILMNTRSKQMRSC